MYSTLKSEHLSLHHLNEELDVGWASESESESEKVEKRYGEIFKEPFCVITDL